MNLNGLGEELVMFRYLEQEVVELAGNKRNIHAMVKEDVSSLVDQVENCAQALLDYVGQEYWESKDIRVNQVRLLGVYDLVLDIVACVAVVDDEVPIQVVCSQIGALLGMDDVFDGIKTAAELLEVMAGECWELVRVNNRLHVRNYIVLEVETRDYISNCQFLPPSVSKPLEVSKNYESGHVSFNQSVLLGKTKYHEGELCLDVINIQNSVGLSLDINMLEYEEEVIKQDLNQDALAQFEVMKHQSRAVYNQILDMGNCFWFHWRYDGCGRLYSVGYQIAHQAGEYKRALINLNKLEVISDE